MLQSLVRCWLFIADWRLNLLSQVLIHLLTFILLHILVASLGCVWHAGLLNILRVLPCDSILVLIAPVLPSVVPILILLL